MAMGGLSLMMMILMMQAASGCILLVVRGSSSNVAFALRITSVSTRANACDVGAVARSGPPAVLGRRVRILRRRRRHERRGDVVGLAPFIFYLRRQPYSMVHIANLTPPGSGGNASRAHGQRHQLISAGVVHVTNATTGSGVPTLPVVGAQLCSGGGCFKRE
jgi:hypothetical protein